MRLSNHIFYAFFLASSLLWSMGCNRENTTTAKQDQDSLVRQPRNEPESTTNGEITIGIEESLYPVLKQEVDAFEHIYQHGVIHVVNGQEEDLMGMLLRDELRLVVTARDFTSREKATIQGEQIKPRATKVGYDAVAVVLNNDNPIDSLSEEQMKAIASGEINNWKDLGWVDKPIVMAFPHPNSGVLTYVEQHYLAKEGKPLPANAYNAEGHENLLNYVSESPNAMGFVGVSWVGDFDNQKVRELLNSLHMVRLEAPEQADTKGYFRPFQNEITLNRYPLKRTIYTLSREHFTGLGTGFVSFTASDRGQKILLKAGLVPEFFPPRMIILPGNEE